MANIILWYMANIILLAHGKPCYIANVDYCSKDASCRHDTKNEIPFQPILFCPDTDEAPAVFPGQTPDHIEITGIVQDHPGGRPGMGIFCQPFEQTPEIFPVLSAIPGMFRRRHGLLPVIRYPRIVNGNLLSGDAWLQPIFRQLLLPARQPPLPKPRFYTRKVVCLSDQPIR
jgi:hypothetical protein